MNINPLKLILGLSLATFIAFVALGIYVSAVISFKLPSMQELENPKQDYATQVFSADGKLLELFAVERRIKLPLDSIPKDFINGLLAVEDRNFYKHWGVDMSRVFKAALKNMIPGRRTEGASTITMQLARNLFLDHSRSLDRKIREAFTAVEIEKRYTKEEILEMYANTVIFGRGAYGINVAAQVYFDKRPMELTTAECAFLVGILKNPEGYNTTADYGRGLNRRNLVLSLMEDQDYITYQQFADAVQQPIELAKEKIRKLRMSYLSPHFVEDIRKSLGKSDDLSAYNLYRDGLLIYTTLDSRIQKYANEAAEEHMQSLQKTFSRAWSWSGHRELLNDLIAKAIRQHPDYMLLESEDDKRDFARRIRRNKKFIDSVKNTATTVQCGVVVLDPSTGSILGMVGASPKFLKENPDSKYSLNHVTAIHRQPGSSFKPIVYASALQLGARPETMIECGPYRYVDPVTNEVWVPSGAGDCEPGEMTSLYHALLRSINTVSARLITKVTSPERVQSLARKLGIQSQLLAVPALSLGAGGEVKPLEMAQVFAAFANRGITIEPFSVVRVEDRMGNILMQKKKSMKVVDAVTPKIAEDITLMLEGAVNYGTGRNVRDYLPMSIEAAGKTGTTNDYADAWFVGFTPQLVCAVWIGFDDQRVSFTSGYGFASQAAAPLWGRLMKKIYSDPTLPYRQRQFRFKPDSAEYNIIYQDSTLERKIDSMRHLGNTRFPNLNIDTSRRRDF